MLSMTIKRITQEYIKAAINTANVVEKQMQELVEQRMYSAEYLEKEKTKIEEVGSVALDMLRSRAINGLSVAFDTARAAIENSIAENANTTEIEELKNILEASGGNLSEFEISVILDKVSGSYWCMRMLNNAVSDKTDAKKILAEKFTAPDPVYYMQLFDETEGKLVSFVKTYDGKDAIQNNQSKAFGEILLSGDYFDNLHDRIMINPYYVNDDDLEIATIRPSERRILRKSGIILDTTDKKSKQLVIEAAHTGGPLRNILIRSTVWTDTIKAEEKRMIEDEHDNMQIKYGTAGKNALDAMGSRY